MQFHKWDVVCGFLVSTADTVDKGLETMVFPAERGKKIEIVEGLFLCYVDNADFGNPLEEYTRHYKNEREAVQGHHKTCKAIEKRYKDGVG